MTDVVLLERRDDEAGVMRDEEAGVMRDDEAGVMSCD